MEPAWQTGWSGGRFRALETTADIGVIAEGPSLPAAISSAAAGFYWVISPAQAVDRGERAAVRATGSDIGVAVARALQRLVVEFDTRGFLGSTALASVHAGQEVDVRLELRGERFAVDRHPQGVEIKAVTHHGLKVERTPPRVEVLFDI